MLNSLNGRATYEHSVATQLLASARELAQDYADTALDANGDFITDADDVLVLYYAYQFTSVLGDGGTGGSLTLWRTFLNGLVTTPDPTEKDLLDLLERANQLNLE